MLCVLKRNTLKKNCVIVKVTFSTSFEKRKNLLFLLRCHLAQQDDAKKDVLCVPNTTTAKSAKYYSRIFYSICMKGALIQIGSKIKINL